VKSTAPAVFTECLRFFKASIKHKWPMAPDPDDEPEDKKSRRRKKR
jgi:hypothetical protein